MYQKKMVWVHQNKVCSREFHKGDPISKKILPIQKGLQKKVDAKPEGPYVEGFIWESVGMTKIDGKNLPNLKNFDSRNKYFT